MPIREVYVEQKMDIISGECPTEVLVDIQDNEEHLFPHYKSKEPRTSSNSVLLKDEIPVSSSLENTPSIENCPTAILIDVSPPVSSYVRNNLVSCSSQHYETNITDSKISNIGCKDIEKNLDRGLNVADSWNERRNDQNSSSSEIRSQMPMKRLRWKTPSPKSMSRISKEASKVIDHLHSSSIFDEDLLLTEEMLPIPLNFDELDEDINQKNCDDNVFEAINLNNKSVISEQLLNKRKNVDEPNSHSSSKNSTSEKISNKLEQTLVETSFKFPSKDENSSKESFSSGIHSGSNNAISPLTVCDEADEVFKSMHIASEDKENVPIKNKLASYKENKIENKTPIKNLSVNKSKYNQYGTLRNISNFNNRASVEHLSLSVNKNVTTPLRRMSLAPNKNMFVPLTEKPQMKKSSISVESRYSMKNLSQSKSFYFQSTKELISSTQKPRSTLKTDSGCSSLSSDVKQQNLLTTPSRRYSICTPLKSASAMKPPLTPVISRSNNFAFPRYTPQPTRPSHLSFSKSWQTSHDNSQLFPAKVPKQKISTTVPASASKITPGIKNTSRSGKISFSQSMSSVPMKLSNRVRFSSKLPSPLSVEQDKRVARALFTSVSGK